MALSSISATIKTRKNLEALYGLNHTTSSDCLILNGYFSLTDPLVFFLKITLVKAAENINCASFTKDRLQVQTFSQKPTYNPLPDDKILDWSKFKRIAGDILKCI